MPRSPIIPRIFTVLVATLFGVFSAPSLKAEFDPELRRMWYTPQEVRDSYDQSTFSYYRFRVPDDHAQYWPNMISLMVLILESPSRVDRAPVVYLSGGPGSAATLVGELPLIQEILKSRDVILLDQRGSGFSYPTLRYPSSVKSFHDVRSFAEFSRFRFDLSLLNTKQSAADVALLSQALGKKLTLFGHSYGTFLAQAVMRDHPEVVESAILAGVVPARKGLLGSQRTLNDGLENLFKDVQQTPAARRDFPNLKKRFHKLLATLDRKPLRIELRYPKRHIMLTSTQFLRTMRRMLGTSEGIRRIPITIQELELGRTDRVGYYFSDYKGSTHEFSPGMQVCVLSSDLLRGSDYLKQRQDASRLAPAMRDFERLISFVQQKSAEIWDVPYHPGNTRRTLRSPIPTLVLSSEMEAQTAQNGGDEVAKHLSRSFHLQFPRSGHSSCFVDKPQIEAIRDFLFNPHRRPNIEAGSLTNSQFYITRFRFRSALGLVEDFPSAPAGVERLWPLLELLPSEY